MTFFIRDLFFAANLAMAAAAFGAGSAAQPEAAIAANYRRPFEPPTRPKFIELPPGAVEPAGWLRDWCLAARDGFTGHMDEYDEAFRQAWAADHTMTGDRLNWPKGGWPYEGGGYWFDGLARLGFALHDDALIGQAKRRLDIVVSRMNPNGILFLWWLNRNSPEDVKGSGVSNAWPMWASGLLGRAMVGYYAGSGDRHVLEALEAGYGGDRDWMRLGWGMSNPWPAFDTYTWTGNKEIAAALTALFSEDGGGKNPGGASWNRYRRMPGQEGGAVENDHVVHFLESTTPWALGYLWTGRREFLDATLAWHDLLERVAMQPHGAPVADEWYGPTGAFRGTETCDVAGYIWSQAALLAVTGEGRMADRLERAFFNAGPATVSRDFKTHVYFQSPNRFANRSPDFPHGPKAGGGSYLPKHSPLCCTAALNRIVPYYVTHMWMATYDNGLAATCYGPCRVTALAADRVPIEIACRTDYPFDESIAIVVRPAKEAEFPLLFHIPGWCANPELRVNGSAIAVERSVQGFARVSRKWAAGDTVHLRFPMGVRLEMGRDVTQDMPRDGAHKATPVRVPDHRGTQGAPYASVSYGPLLFALPIPDTNDPNTPDPSAQWRYALDARGSDFAVERGPMPARWDWPQGSPLRLCAKAMAFDWNPVPESPRLPAEPVARRRAPEKITLIPYGCTKFRISMFPVVAENRKTE